MLNAMSAEIDGMGVGMASGAPACSQSRARQPMGSRLALSPATDGQTSATAPAAADIASRSEKVPE